MKALVVDDEKRTRDFLDRHVSWKTLGYSDVALAEDGEQALTLALEWKPDLILTDIKMPRMNGIQLAEHVRHMLPSCRIIFLSAHSEKELLKSAIQLQVADYIEKPIDLEALNIAVGKTASMPRPQLLPIELDTLSQTAALDLCSRHSNPQMLFPILEQLHFPRNGHYAALVLKVPGEEGWRAFSDFQSDPQLGVFMLRSASQPTPQSEIIVLGGTEASAISGAIDRLRSLLQICEERKIKLFISVGNTVPSLTAIPDSFESAKQLLEQRFFIGETGLVSTDALQEYGPAFETDDQLPYAVYQWLKNKDKPSILAAIDTLSEAAASCRAGEARRVRDAFFSVLVRIDQFISEYNLTQDEAPEAGRKEKVYLWELVASFPTLRHARHYLLRLIDWIFEQLDNQFLKQEKVPEILGCIRDRLGDPNLGVNLIARELFVTPSYLCLVFRKQTGITINQYITSERMEEARRLIAGTDLLLHEVALRSGYYDPKYFTKVFKKTFGVTPSDYKRNVSK